MLRLLFLSFLYLCISFSLSLLSHLFGVGCLFLSFHGESRGMLSLKLVGCHLKLLSFNLILDGFLLGENSLSFGLGIIICLLGYSSGCLCGLLLLL